MQKGLLSTAWSGLRHDDEGAITVDWVVVTAIVVSLGVVSASLIWGKSGGIAHNVEDFLETRSVQAAF